MYVDLSVVKPLCIKPYSGGGGYLEGGRRLAFWVVLPPKVPIVWIKEGSRVIISESIVFLDIIISVLY